MNQQDYYLFMQEKLASFFDFRPVDSFSPFAVDLFAVHNRQSEKYFFTKKINLYSIQNDEYILLKLAEPGLTPETLRQWSAQLKQAILQMLQIGPDHMSSVVTLAVISQAPFAPETIAALQKIKYHKDFMFTLRGWVDLAVVGADLATGKLYSNRFGKKVLHNYEWTENDAPR